jgi:hypothetical protein
MTVDWMMISAVDDVDPLKNDSAGFCSDAADPMAGRL